MLGKLDTFFVTANYIEAVLWTVIGIGFFLHAIVNRGRATSVVAAVAFFLFGISDVIETQTGAWWRPWWLLVLKGACVMTFAALLARHYRARRRATLDTARQKTSNPASR